MEERPNSVDREIGSRLRERRNALALSEQALAHYLNVADDTIEKYETGALRIPVNHLRALCALLEVNPQYFFEGKVNAPNWLASALGKDGAPTPPAIDSDRIKEMLGRALLQPGSLAAVEVQEVAASVISHLVQLKRP